MTITDRVALQLGKQLKFFENRLEELRQENKDSNYLRGSIDSLKYCIKVIAFEWRIENELRS